MKRSGYAELLTAIEAFDLEAYLLERGGFRASRSSSHSEEWIGTCPLCGKEKLCVDVQKKGWHCWVCQTFEDVWVQGQLRRRPVQGAGGVLALVKLLEGLTTREAVEFMVARAEEVNLHELPDLRVLDVAPASAATITLPEGSAGIESPLPYMVRRGITMDDVRWLGLCAVFSGRYANRLVFPVYEYGRLVYWQARAMYEAEESPHARFIKAINPEKTPGAATSDQVLLNLDVACRWPRVAIVEGPMDCLRTGMDAVCTFGKRISPVQIQRLLERGVKAIDLMWDGPKEKEPEGAWPEMHRVAPQLQGFFDVRLVYLPHGDPADWSREDLTQIRAQAAPLGPISRLSTL